MRNITTYADYKKEQQTRDRVKKCVLWTSLAVLGLVAVFGLGYFAGRRAMSPMANIGECITNGANGYMTTAHDVICLYD